MPQHTNYDHYIPQSYLRQFACKNNRNFIKAAKKPLFEPLQDDKRVNEICGEIGGDNNFFINNQDDIKNILKTFETKLGEAIKFFKTCANIMVDTPDYNTHKSTIAKFITSILISHPVRRKGLTELIKNIWKQEIEKSSSLSSYEKRQRYLCLNALFKDEKYSTTLNPNRHQWVRTIFLENFCYWADYINLSQMLFIRHTNSNQKFITSDHPLCSLRIPDSKQYVLWIPLHPTVGLYCFPPSTTPSHDTDIIETICNTNPSSFELYKVSSVDDFITTQNTLQKDNCSEFILGDMKGNAL